MLALKVSLLDVVGVLMSEGIEIAFFSHKLRIGRRVRRFEQFNFRSDTRQTVDHSFVDLLCVARDCGKNI